MLVIYVLVWFNHMESLFPNPLCNDGADKFNYKWMPLLLLLLSVIALIVPLHPLYHEKPIIPPQTKMKPLGHPKVKVICFPTDKNIASRFTDAQARFTSAFCGNAFNKVVKGEKNDGFISLPGGKHLPSHAEYTRDLINVYRLQQKNLYEFAFLKDKLRQFVTFKIPLTILAAGIWLTIPQFTWTFLSECFSQMNVGKTLESAVKGSLIAKVLQKKGFDSTASSASALYLLKKLLSVVMVIIFTIVTSAIPRKEAGILEKDIKSHQEIVNNANETIELDSLFESPNDTFICHIFLEINKQTIYNLCTITEVEHFELKPQSLTETLLNLKSLLEFEVIVFDVMTGLLIFLVVTNILSLTSWACYLMCSPPRYSLGFNSATPMDMLLFVQMATINLSADVVNNITQDANDTFANFHFSVPSSKNNDTNESPSLEVFKDKVIS